MKVELSNAKPIGFQPVTISITLESEAEFNALFHVGNYNGGVAEFLQKVEPSDIDEKVATQLFYEIYSKLNEEYDRLHGD